ncbi:MAG: hypothetical protein LBQ50_08895 [Planctomycetaceae bacterium]|jgi:hypothetical protein|nr:hypothetical protein [Planctomycetaceae bacterium]
MKNFVGFHKTGQLVLVSVLVFLTMLGLSIPTLYAEEWGPYLGPAFPEVEEEIDDSYMPDPIIRSKGKQLPLPAKKRAVRTVSQHADFDEILNSNKTIIPQQLLNDEPVSETTPSVPKTRTKMPTRINEALTLAPPLSTDETLNEGEWIVDESIGQDWTALPNPYENTFSGTYGNNYVGMYNENSPALESGYFNPMMIKPFGTGLFDNVTVFAGTTGFKGEMDAGSNGNFGFTEGFNWAGPATPQRTLSGQIGFRAVQSNVNGNRNTNRNSRNQYFVTVGLFKRSLSFPVQGGAAFDWLHDDFYGKIRVQQIRYEISARTFSNTEYGFLGGFGMSKKGNNYLNNWKNAPGETHTFALQAQTYYLLFLRKHFTAGGLAEFRCGLTDDGDTILAGLGEFPVSDRFSLNGSFSAMIPEEGHGRGGWQRENWEISVGVTFYFRGGACSKPTNSCRPMFDVSGNGSFFNRIVRK